jgi:hypothetical protein
LNTDQQHKLIEIAGVTIPGFSYEKHGIKGVGKYRHPIISMDSYIDHSKDLELHIECCKGLALSEDYRMGMVYGSLPPDEVQRLSGNNCWTETLATIEDRDPTGIHREAIREIADSVHKDKQLYCIFKYCYFALGSAIPWFYACHIKTNDFMTKTQADTSTWTNNAKYFPNVIKYLDTLPFKVIGRVLFFTTYPNAGVITHRDSIVAEHKDHNINLFFDGGCRPSYIWDDINKQKVYLPKDSKSYFFNNRDYHGVDSEPVYRYTLRVDGTFTDELCEQLGLEDGYTWKWDYEKI